MTNEELAAKAAPLFGVDVNTVLQMILKFSGPLLQLLMQMIEEWDRLNPAPMVSAGPCTLTQEQKDLLCAQRCALICALCRLHALEMELGCRTY